MKKKRILNLFTAAAMAAVLGLTGCSIVNKPAELSTPSVTEVSTTEATTPEPTTQVKTTEEPTTEEPTTEEPTTEEPTTEEPTAPPATSMTVGTTWFVSADTLNLREGPSTDAAIIDKIYRGEEVLLLANPENGFVRVLCHAGEGFISTSYLVNTPPASVSASELSEAAAQPAAKNHTICIDAGHQAYGISETEPNGPGSSVMKAKLTTGTSGVATGVAERDFNLVISLGLQTELQNRGYNVVMIRTTNDCTLSNAERAQVANSSGAEVFLRIHANSSDNPEVAGAMFYVPSAANPYMSQELIAASNALGNTLLNVYCNTAGFQNRGLLQDDTMTGINWCQVPVTIAELGFMSNPAEDQRMQDPSVQALIVQGLADGIDTYFGYR